MVNISQIVFWIVLISLLIFRLVSSQPRFIEGDAIMLSGRVSSEPIRYEYSQGFEVEGVFVFLPAYPEINYRDTVVVTGVIDDGELTDAELIEHKPANGIAIRFREKLLNTFNRSLPKPHSSLVAGMVIGSKSLIDRELWKKLKTSGTAHVVVASGMNISLVASFVTNTLVSIMKRKHAIVISIFVIWFYAFIAGFDAPIVRAALMATVGFIGIVLGRMRYAWRAFFLTAVVMIIYNPKWVGDLGFILSFVATASLMKFERPIRRRLKWIPQFVREDLSTTLAAQIGVVPVFLFTLGEFNFWSPFTNVLVLWTVVPITVIGMISGVLGLFIPSIAGVVILVSYPLTSWFLSVVNVVA